MMAGDKQYLSKQHEVQRHEAKYLIPERLVPAIRQFIEPFCERDPYGAGELPEYTITTLQLDSPDLALHRAKENEALTRFKLRVRTYGEPGTTPAFMEVKRKIRGAVVKNRCTIPFEQWGEQLIREPMVRIPFASEKQYLAFLEFKRLTQQIGARPLVLIRYRRESYFGKNDSYARVTFDRHLEYQPTASWNDFGRSGIWRSIDTPFSQKKNLPYSGVVLEVKALDQAPLWMMDMIMQFNLVRVGNCKYSTAVWNEQLFRGADSELSFEGYL